MIDNKDLLERLKKFQEAHRFPRGIQALNNARAIIAGKVTRPGFEAPHTASLEEALKAGRDAVTKRMRSRIKIVEE